MEIVLVGLACLLAGIGIGVLTARRLTKEAFSVITYPYKEDSGTDGLFSDDRRMEVGYKFQLFINGIPCFDAHKIPVETFEKKQVSPSKIEAASQTAIGIIQQMAQLHPAIRAYSSAAEVGSEAGKLLNKPNNSSKRTRKKPRAA